MKSFFFSGALLALSFTSYGADVRQFQDTVEFFPSNIKIERVHVVAQSFFSGGQGALEKKNVKALVKIDGNQISYNTLEGVNFVTNKLFRQFYNCTIYLEIFGRNNNGDLYYATKKILESNSKKTCKSDSAIDEKLEDYLSQNNKVKLINSNPGRLHLEILDQ